MTTTEIKNFVDSAINGQGNQVDLGGKLGEVIATLIGERPFVIKETFEDSTKEEALAALECTEEELDALINGEYLYLDMGELIVARTFMYEGVVGYGSMYQDYGESVIISKNGDKYSVFFHEV